MTRVLVPKGPRVEAQRREQQAAEWLRRPYDPPMPGWLQLRDDQLDAVEKIQAEYDRGSRVVFLDAPTGAGKTSVAELTRRRLGVSNGLYVCTTKSLQAQVARDFDYARVLKGRANYTPTNVTPRQRDGYRQGYGGLDGLRITCADCDRGPRDAEIEEQTCTYCAEVLECPYLVARYAAMVAPMGVLNTSYLLTVFGGGGKNNPWRDRELVVADECDLLEDELLGYVEVQVGAKWVDRLGLEVPKKGSHMTTIRRWLEEEVEPGLVELRRQLAGAAGTLEGRREHGRCDDLVRDVRRVLERPDGWVRDGDEEGDRSGNALVLKPVSVEDVGDKFLWSHAEKWLCMSGTIVSADTMADALGLTAAGIEWGVVEMPMRFRAENRRVVYAPMGSMTRKEQDATMPKVLRAVDRIVERHAGENMLIHTHTYLLAKTISDHLIRAGVPGVLRYESGRWRDHTLELFRKNGGVLVAPSMDRGVDLPGDLCRVQVIVKVPMASLGSRQVSERLRTPGGNDWYLANTVRTLMQMTGRAVRGEDDWAVCYVLDSHFGKVLGDGKRRGMFPQWWLDGLEMGRVREYV